jgi:putative ABC transport system permease protein
MRKVAFRGMFARKLRMALTALSVALGVCLIAGTYVFTDTINQSFDRIFSESAKGTDAAITPRKAIDTSQNGGTQPVLPRRLLATVRNNDDVQDAQGSVFDVATVLGKDGERVGLGGAPNFVASVADVPRFDGFTVKEGRKPRTADEATIDASTAEKENFKLGDKVSVVAEAPRKAYTIVGTTQIAGVDSFGGATVVDLTLPEAQRMLGKDGFDQIQASAQPGITPEALRDSLRRDIGRQAVVRTGQEEATNQAGDIQDGLGFLTTALLAFAGISLFVGAFIIFNTFSITVTQRMREFALLRTLGASRGQIMRSVIGEGLVLGVVGSLVGLALGMAIAPGLRALFRAVGVDLPSTGNVVATRTIVVSLVIGTLVSVLAGLAPALRATRVPPVAALREVAVPAGRGPSRKVTVAGALLAVLGIGLMAVGLFGSLTTNAALSFTGAGAAATFLGVALVSPWLVRPLASLIGRPIERLTGITGRLARENSVRQPGRTAVTAAALMIGVALVTFASIFAAGAQKTIAKAVDDNLEAAFVVQNVDGFSPFSANVLRTIDRVPGVSDVSAVRFSQAEVRGVDGRTPVSGIDPRTLRGLYSVSEGAGALATLRTGQVLLSKGFAEDNKLERGDTLALSTPIGRRLSLPVHGIVDDNGDLTSAVVVTNAQMLRDFGEPKDAFGLVGLASGADEAQVQGRVDRVLERQYP